MNNDTLPFEGFPKIPRLRRECTITEKIDGTNALVHIRLADGSFEFGRDIQIDGVYLRAGSRSRWITPDDDNFGFARWVHANAPELAKLGLGSHFGEWYGIGIQRRYGLDHKRFALFNTPRWENNPDKPLCCGVVPVLHVGPFSDEAVNATLFDLRTLGSAAVPGFMQPEGIVVYMHASRTLHKVLLENDELPKGVKEKD